MKTTSVSNSTPSRREICVRCFLCGGCIDHDLEYLIWEDEESRFWLCQKCSSMFAVETQDLDNQTPIATHTN